MSEQNAGTGYKKIPFFVLIQPNTTYKTHFVVLKILQACNQCRLLAACDGPVKFHRIFNQFFNIEQNQNTRGRNQRNCRGASTIHKLTFLTLKIFN